MDYTGFYEFPFPSVLSEEGAQVKKYFLSLKDEEQMKLLNGSLSYESFYDRVVRQMKDTKSVAL